MAKHDGVYKRADRRGYWISWKDAQGRRRRRIVKVKYLEQAKSARAAELQRVEGARALGFTPPGDDSFDDVATRFTKHQEARLTTKAYERDKLIAELHLKEFFSGRVAAIRRVDVQRYVTKRSPEASAHTVLKELNVLKHMLRLAVEWEIIPVNPAQGVRSPKVPAGRVRYLQPTELTVLLAECPVWLRPIVVLLVATGMRRSEVLGLRWLDVDLKNRLLLLPQTKNGEGRIVYMNEIALGTVQSLPVGPETKTTDRLFPEVTPEQVSVAFERARGKTKIADFRLHDLRHTAASWLRMQGADIHTVAQLLGHKDLRMAARYQHLSPAFLGEAVKGLDVVFGEACHQGVTSVKALPEPEAVSA